MKVLISRRTGRALDVCERHAAVILAEDNGYYPTHDRPLPACGVCEVERAAMACPECAEWYDDDEVGCDTCAPLKR